jgi:Ca2+-binding RTX toxin-like protein
MIAGSSGNDILHGDNGDNIVDGGSRNDQVSGDHGVNTPTGGPGRDAFVCGPNGLY